MKSFFLNLADGQRTGVVADYFTAGYSLSVLPKLPAF